MKRPTPKPLTGTERAELDKLIRRAAGAINSADGSRLVRLLDLDQSDRAQERRTAGGTERTNRELTQKLKDAEAAAARVRGMANGADPANPCKHHDHLCPYDIMTALDGLGAP